MDQAGGCGEVLVPWDIWEDILHTTDRALEEDHPEGCLEDLRVVDIQAESLAELRDGSVSMANNIIVNLLAHDTFCGLHVCCSDAQTAVKVCFVGLQRRKDDISSRGSMLIGVQDREDELRHFIEEVVQKVHVAVVNVNDSLVAGCERAVRKVEEVKINGFFGKLLRSAFVEFLLYPTVGRQHWQAIVQRRRLIGTKR